MKIGAVNNWHRPYYVLASNKWYQINKIKFYKDNEILVESNSGWLETTRGDIKELELPVDEIKLKRKEKFDGTVFLISQGKDWSGELKADLYIPADMLNVHFVRHEIAFKTQVRAVFEGEQGIYISTYVNSLDSELHAIRDEYEKVLKEVDGYCLAHRTEDIIQNIDKLKELAEKYKAEQHRVDNLTIDDIEI